MKEIDGWVKIKKYTDDEGKPVCGRTCTLRRNDPSGYGACLHSGRFPSDKPKETCPVWYGEIKSGWQPIETAPKDGTEVDLFVPVLGRRTDCAFAQGEWVEWGPDSFDTIERVSLKPYTPTHWMPLPSPPSEEEKQVVNLGHVTRFSDSSLYDEVCCNCGATDARGDDRLIKPCPHAQEK